MSNYHILDCINRGRRGHVSFHTPGHKGGGSLSSVMGICSRDVTELSYTDDLSGPTGPIAAAQSDIAMICGAKRAYITTDGSTSGILAMMYAVGGRGGKLIVPRNSHKSVWNACKLLHIEPVIVQGEERDGVMLPPDASLVASLAARDPDIIGMIAVSPDYYGNIAPLEKYAEAMHACGRVLLVDGAHGAHLAFEGEGAGYAGSYADIWVDGAHKSLPALTQGAAVFLNDLHLEGALKDGLSVFRTTSPSFPVMASVEFAYKYLLAHPQDIAAAKGALSEFKKRCPDYRFYPSADWTKLCLDCAPLSADSRRVASLLEKSGIYAEFADGRYLVFYLSAETRARHFKALERALERALEQRGVRSSYIPRKKLPVFSRAYSYLYALGRPAEYVPLEESAGRMCAENAGLMPPCIPVVAAGEIITEDAAALLKSGTHTFGITDGKIKVVKRNEGQIHNI